jgi:Coenzyme PQQ synthesis protein D (PqqD)
MLHNSSYQSSENILSQKVGSETVLLDMRSSKYFGLTPVASRIWELVVAGHPTDAASEIIAKEHNMPAEQVHQDVLVFIDTLASRGLLTPRP